METKSNEEKTKVWKAANLVIQALSSQQVKETSTKEEKNKDSAGSFSSCIIVY